MEPTSTRRSSPARARQPESPFLAATSTGPNRSGTTIGRANLDGSAINESFVTGADSPAGVAVSGPYVYWANFGGPHGTRGSTIGRAKLDGTGANQHFITGAKSPGGITVAAG